MKKKTLSLAILSLPLFALTACNDSNTPTDSGKETIDVTKAIEFKVNFADFNAEKTVDGTRAARKPDTISREIVDLGNNIQAEVTVQKDTTRTATPQTRALDDDNYTMLVFQGSQLKAEVSGTLTAGKFSTNMNLQLAPGQYTFILHNNRMTKGNTPFGTTGLTLTRENAEKALIAQRTYTVTATPDPQYVDFNMEHVGTRMRIKLTGWMPIQATTTASIQDELFTMLPKDCQFELPLNGTVINKGKLQNLDQPLTFPASATTPASDGTFTSTSNEYLYFVPGVDMQGFRLKFTGGQIYKINMAGVTLPLISLPDPSPHQAQVMDSNESYLVNINLKYNFLYLMSDGSTDFLNSTQYTALRAGDGTTPRYVDKHGNPLATPKIPVAVVLSQSQRMAIALNEANGGAKTDWCTSTYYTKQTNTHRVTNPNDALGSMATSGLDETWEASYSSNNVTIEKVKALNSDFPAFRAAADYIYGLGYTGSPASRSYLPSYSDFKWAYSALGFGDKTTVTQVSYPYIWYGRLADLPFTQAGGTTIINRPYWTSTETYNAGAILLYPNSIWYFDSSKSFKHNYVRPFIKY